MEPCRLCNILKSSSQPLRSDLILESNADFICTPALGALVPGYVMLVSKRHFIDICDMDANERDNLHLLIAKLTSRAPYISGYLLFLHGAPACELSSSCIDHFHLHLIPILDLNASGVLKLVDLPIEVSEITSVVDKPTQSDKKSYIIVSDSNNSFFIQADEFPSQYIRRIIAKHIGKDDEWNWAIYPHDKLIELTIDMYNTHEHC